MNGPVRREMIKQELASLIGGEDSGLRAGMVLDLLQGAGLLYWGEWPDPQIPEGEADLEFAALRLSAESWWAIPVDAANAPELMAYWRAVNVLGVRGPAGGMLDVGGLTPRQRGALLEIVRDIVRELEEVENDDDSGGDPSSQGDVSTP